MDELSIAHCPSNYYTPLPYIVAQKHYFVKSRQALFG
jgi:hypothetical protein